MRTRRCSPLGRLWQRAAADPEFVAGRWHGTPQALAAQLGCSPTRALLVGLCRAPASEAGREAWVRRIADHFCLDPDRVRALAERLMRVPGDG